MGLAHGAPPDERSGLAVGRVIAGVAAVVGTGKGTAEAPSSARNPCRRASRREPWRHLGSSDSMASQTRRRGLRTRAPRLTSSRNRSRAALRPLHRGAGNALQHGVQHLSEPTPTIARPCSRWTWLGRGERAVAGQRSPHQPLNTGRERGGGRRRSGPRARPGGTNPSALRSSSRWESPPSALDHIPLGSGAVAQRHDRDPSRIR